MKSIYEYVLTKNVCRAQLYFLKFFLNGASDFHGIKIGDYLGHHLKFIPPSWRIESPCPYYYFFKKMRKNWRKFWRRNFKLTVLKNGEDFLHQSKNADLTQSWACLGTGVWACGATPHWSHHMTPWPVSRPRILSPNITKKHSNFTEPCVSWWQNICDRYCKKNYWCGTCDWKVQSIATSFLVQFSQHP